MDPTAEAPVPTPLNEPVSETPAAVAPARRNDVIDALKYFAIALVILTHVLRLRREFIHLSPDLLRIIVSFNLPLFAFLSGWVLAGREGRHPLLFMRGKFLGLLVPYLAWIAVEMPLRHVPPSGYLARLGNALLNPMFGMQMWFLWALFWMFAIFTAGRVVSQSDWWTLALAVAVGSIALFIPGGANGLNRIAWLYPYLILGYLVSKRRATLRRFDAWATAAALPLFAAVSVFGSRVLPLQLAAGVAGTVAACGIFRFMPAQVPRALAPLGRRTLGIYGAQMVVFPFLIVGRGWAGAIASWAIVLAASTVVALVLDRFTFTRAVFLGQWPRKARA
jgi:fucose 4-O-acetylase-like acetyltransferase